ncbi:unnamed protein product [Calicophoron daubneyi]|uniref:Uncharacterized protein n=1 Tax=Calicophoron daubneyi TaxID=300641 RepID=A0AAV2T0Z0_CALDB
MSQISEPLLNHILNEPASIRLSIPTDCPRVFTRSTDNRGLQQFAVCPAGQEPGATYDFNWTALPVVRGEVAVSLGECRRGPTGTTEQPEGPIGERGFGRRAQHRAERQSEELRDSQCGNTTPLLHDKLKGALNVQLVVDGLS